MGTKKDVAVKYPYPSRFGSHKSMLTSQEDNGIIENWICSDGTKIEDIVWCTDEFGEYATQRSRLDNGLADPNRCREARLGSLFSRTQKDEK